MSENEQKSSQEKKKRRPKLFQKIVTLFVGVPALVSTLTYGEYRYQYQDPISRGVNVSELFKRYYESGSPKDSFMDMIVDSEYDNVTKTWLINVASDYKDALISGGINALNTAVDQGVTPSLPTISRILSTADDENRKTAIYIETAREKSHEKLLSSLDSAEFNAKLHSIISSQKPEMSLSDVQQQEAEISGFSFTPNVEIQQKFRPRISKLEPSLQTSLLILLDKAGRVIMMENGVHKSFDEASLELLIGSIEQYLNSHGSEATQFLLNALEFQGIGSNCLPENIATTFSNISNLYKLFKAHDQISLDFMLGKGKVPPDYVGAYYSDLINLENGDWQEAPQGYHELFTEIAGGNAQLGSVLLIDYFLKISKWERTDVPDTIEGFKKHIESFQAVQMIKKYKLSEREVLFFLEIYGSLRSTWSEEKIQEFRDKPELMRLPKNYFYVGYDNEKVKVAYNHILNKLPDNLSQRAKSTVFYLIQEAIDRVSVSFSSEQLEQMFHTEILSYGDIKLMKVENNFSLADAIEKEEHGMMVDVPLVLQGVSDSFLAFDESNLMVTPDLKSMEAKDIIQSLSTFHFLYEKEGVLHFGSIAEIFSTVTQFNTVTELVELLKQNNITSLTRVLPVMWDGETVSPEGHSSRINAQEFTGVVVVTDENGLVQQQRLIMIPPYQLLEINKAELGNLLNTKPGEQVQLLLPDAGYATTFSTASLQEQTLSYGAQQLELQGIRFLVK